jgi:hypothetical protein
MLNPYIVCTWVFILSLLYPLHGITTFPLNIVCAGGIMGTNFNELSFGTFYGFFSHLGPFLWVPWAITYESIILFLFIFYIYTLVMLLVFKKNPLDYYSENEGKKGDKKWFIDMIDTIKKVLY